MRYKISNETFRQNEQLAVYIQEWVESQGVPMSVRRVFYAMVTQQKIDNTMDKYKLISRILTKLRRMGRLDWDLIIDSTRSSYKTPDYENAGACVRSALNSFRLNRWQTQNKYLEIWVEKRGLVSVLYPITNKLDVHIVENGGQKAITFDQIEGFFLAQDEGKKSIILYIGDYDPSGLRIDLNMKKQLDDFGVLVQWQRVALTLAQVQAQQLPPAFTVPDTATDDWIKEHPGVEILGYNKSGRPLVNKLEKDPNAGWFRQQHGGELFQIEVDALEIKELQGLVLEAINEHMDRSLYDEVLRVEDGQRTAMAAQLLE